MSDTLWGWKAKLTGGLHVSAKAKTIEELFQASKFGLPVREVPDYTAVRVKFDAAAAKWIEDIEDEGERMMRLIREMSTS
jgi:hypothetical protein